MGSFFTLGLFVGCVKKEQEPQELEDLRPLIEPKFAMNEVVLLNLDEGFDLIGDGILNNGFAHLFEDPMVGPALGGDPNECIAKTVRGAEILILIDVKNFQGYKDDKNSIQ